MALVIEKAGAPGKDDILADRRLFLAADEKTVVEEGDARCAFLLVAAGSVIFAKQAKQLGLTLVEGKVVLSGATVPAAEKKDEPTSGSPQQEETSSKTDEPDAESATSSQSEDLKSMDIEKLRALALEKGIDTPEKLASMEAPEIIELIELAAQINGEGASGSGQKELDKPEDKAKAKPGTKGKGLLGKLGLGGGKSD